jgi:UDPglucose--hexose-1-phosphate uridylyltransferase
MELRRDPVTQSWVIQEDSPEPWSPNGDCPLCPGKESLSPQTLYEHPFGQPNWQVRVVPHMRPLYRIEGDAQRRGEGIYDKMRNMGAHEIIIETPDHHGSLSQLSDENAAQVLRAAVSRITDLKKDSRFRYVTFFRHQRLGERRGHAIAHPHSEITATPFIPRRIVYELRSSLRYYELKERCLLCDILKQELSQQSRTVEWDDRYVALCPFASRAPYETWILPANHHHAFEEDVAGWEEQLHLARFMKSIIRRIESIAPDYDLVMHTAPNIKAKFDKKGHWQSLELDFHWHFEIMPVESVSSKPYSVKEVYYNSLLPEAAARELRNASVPAEVRR